MRGRMRQLGVRAVDLDAKATLDLFYVLLFDQLTDGWVNREELLDSMDTSLADASALPKRERWGTSPQAVASARAMMALAGGAPKTKRPAAARPPR